MLRFTNHCIVRSAANAASPVYLHGPTIVALTIWLLAGAPAGAADSQAPRAPLGSLDTPAAPRDPFAPTEEEELPPVGRDNLFNEMQIRYCHAQLARINAVRPLLDRYQADHVAYFNAQVADLNSRCGNYRYSGSALGDARAWLQANRAHIEQEARAAYTQRFLEPAIVKGLDEGAPAAPPRPAASERSASAAPREQASPATARPEAKPAGAAAAQAAAPRAEEGQVGAVQRPQPAVRSASPADKPDRPAASQAAVPPATPPTAAATAQSPAAQATPAKPAPGTQARTSAYAPPPAATAAPTPAPAAAPAATSKPPAQTAAATPSPATATAPPPTPAATATAAAPAAAAAAASQPPAQTTAATPSPAAATAPAPAATATAAAPAATAAAAASKPPAQTTGATPSPSTATAAAPAAAATTPTPPAQSTATSPPPTQAATSTAPGATPAQAVATAQPPTEASSQSADRLPTQTAAAAPTPSSQPRARAATGPEAALERLTQDIQRDSAQVLDPPPEASHKGSDLTTQIELRYAAGGYIRSIVVGESSGSDVLDRQALEVARALRYPAVPEALHARDFAVRFPIVFRARR